MKVYQSNEIKNISLVGSAGSGKTTLLEAMAYVTGLIQRRGTVESKNTVSDFFQVEQEYGYSVFPGMLQAEWLDKKLNVIDCPGAEDFIGGVISSMQVTDTALMLINSQYGVEAGTQNHFRFTEKMKKPVIFLMNKLDVEKANYDASLESLREFFGNKVVQVQYPLSVGDSFDAVIDVLLMKMYKWKAEGGAPEILDIPEAEIEKANDLHNKLVEAAAEHEEGLMDKYFAEGNLSEDDMRMGIRLGLIHRDIFPVFCACAGRDMGTRRLMEFLGNVVPFVSDMPKAVTVDEKDIALDSNGPLSIFVFKTNVEPHIGDVNYFKVMSGKIKEGDDVVNANRGSKERIAQLFAVSGQTKTKVNELVAGDIGVTVKLKDVHTGNTLNGKDAEFQFKEVDYPAYKFRRGVRAVKESDEEKLAVALTRMHEEDPTWIVEYSKELKQTIVYGQGEFHLRTLKWRIEHIDKIDIVFDEPKIPYRETITKASQADYRHKKQSGGAGQFGEVHMIIEPFVDGVPAQSSYKINGSEIKINVRDKQTVDLDWGGKLEFISSIVGGAIDARFLPAIMKGVMEKMEEGPLTGSYARDVRVIVYDGKMHTVDSNEISFKLAGRNAFSEAFKNAAPKILEPVYDLEVQVTSDCLGDAMSEIQNRRGIIMGMQSEKGNELITAKVPLKELYNFATALSSITGGRSYFKMGFASYELVPSDVQQKLLKEYESKSAE